MAETNQEYRPRVPTAQSKTGAKEQAKRTCPHCLAANPDCKYCGGTGEIWETRSDGFLPGHMINLRHGINIKDDPLKLFPVEYHVIVGPEMTYEALADCMEPLQTYLEMMSDRLLDEVDILTAASLASYSRLITELLVRIEQIRQGKLRGMGIEKLPPEAMAEKRARMARNLSRVLTQLKFVIARTNKLPIIQKNRKTKKEQVAPWVAGASKLVNAAVKAAEGMAKLDIMDRGGAERNNVVDGYIDALD